CSRLHAPASLPASSPSASVSSALSSAGSSPAAVSAAAESAVGVSVSSAVSDVQPASARAPAATTAMVARLIFNVPPSGRSPSGWGQRWPAPFFTVGEPGGCVSKIGRRTPSTPLTGPNGDWIVTHLRLRPGRAGRHSRGRSGRGVHVVQGDPHALARLARAAAGADRVHGGGEGGRGVHGLADGRGGLPPGPRAVPHQLADADDVVASLRELP